MPEYSKQELEKSKHFQELVNQAEDRLRARGRRFVRLDEVSPTRQPTRSENSNRKTTPQEPGKPSLASEIRMQLEQVAFEQPNLPTPEALELATKRAKESLQHDE